MKPMKKVIFLGPSLPRDRVPEAARAALEIRPPVGQGDVLRALADGATHVGIVDGFFDQVPAVWHKEILHALDEGVVVYGASSMGALRAAELHVLGMIGVGRVFEMYRDGVLEDDDEVAILHEDESTGYRSVSEAMVNLRDRLDAAVAAGILERAPADALVAALKALPYPHRSVRRLIALAASPALEAFLRAPPEPSLKERDALALVLRMISQHDAPAPAVFRGERTVFLERLRAEVQRERWTAASKDAAEAPARSAAEARAVLLALLGREHAAVAGIAPADEEVQAVMHAFQVAHELHTVAAAEAWLAERGLTVPRFIELATEQATLRKVELLYRAEIERRLHDWLDWP